MGLTPVVICLTTLGDGQVRHVHVCVNACGCMGACKLERERASWCGERRVELEAGDGNKSDQFYSSG